MNLNNSSLEEVSFLLGLKKPRAQLSLAVEGFQSSNVCLLKQEKIHRAYTRFGKRLFEFKSSRDTGSIFKGK